MNSAQPSAIRRHFTGVLCLALFGCGGGGDDGAVPIEAVPADAGSLRWISVPAGTHLIKSQSAWAQIWQSHQAWSASSQPIPAPAVDFGRYAIAGLSIGDPACRSIALKQLLRKGGTVTIQYSLAYATGSGCLQFPGSGAVFYLVPADTTEVRADLS